MAFPRSGRLARQIRNALLLGLTDDQLALIPRVKKPASLICTARDAPHALETMVRIVRPPKRSGDRERPFP
jgi:hypothetical protein